jgi:hypothetical protein
MNKVLQYQIDHVLPQQAERFGFQLNTQVGLTQI